MTIEEMKTKIMDLMRLRRSGVSFVELRDAVGDDFDGDRAMCGREHQNMLLWMNMSPDAVKAVTELLHAGLIEMNSTSVLVYMADGRVPSIPVAKQVRQYKSARWVPVCFRLCEDGK